MTKKEEIEKYILKHPDAPNSNIAVKFKTSADFVSNARTSLRKKKLLPKYSGLKNVATPIESPQEIIKRLTKENHDSRKELSQIRKELEFINNIDNYDPVKFDIPVPSNKHKHEGAAIIQWSDWHVEEEVSSQNVNGFNEFDQAIAKERCENLFPNSIKIIDTQRSAIDINDLVLQLGGDFITGYIHPEGEQTNSLSPIDACFYAIDLLVNGIEYLLHHGKFRSIKAVCNRGNHGRTTKRVQSNDNEMNYENFIYYFLMKHFAKEKRVNFLISKSSYAYIKVYGKRLRFFHGHQVKFKGGIGGLTIPLYKLLHRLDANDPAYYNFMCDKHTYSQPTPDCQCNGSLIGFNAYAEDHGFKFQEPLQSFTLLDSKRGITIKAPIFCK